MRVGGRNFLCIAKVLRTVGSAGSVHSPAGATPPPPGSLDSGMWGYMGGPDETWPSDWTTFRVFETPAAALPSVLSQLEPAEFRSENNLSIKG